MQNPTTQQYGPGSNYGYVCGGSRGYSSYSTIDRFQFSFDSGTANKVGNLSRRRYDSSANNSSTYGYVCGGIAVTRTFVLWTSASWTSIIDRFQFPFDEGTTNYVGNLCRLRCWSGANNSSTHGYVSGGYNSNYYLATIDRFQFSFDSGTANQIGNLSGSRERVSANNSSTHGYVCGGYSRNNLSTIDRFQFPFDSGTADFVCKLSRSRESLSANNSSTYGYVYGGWSVSCGHVPIIDRFQFLFDDGVASQVGDLSGSRSWSGANNSSTHGYVCGGYYSFQMHQGSLDCYHYSTIDRVQFPFDGGTANYVGNLSGKRSALSATDGVDFVTMFV